MRERYDLNPTRWRCAWLVDRQRRRGKGEIPLESQSYLDQGQGNGKSHSDRSQVTGGELLIGQLAVGSLGHLGYLTSRFR